MCWTCVGCTTSRLPSAGVESDASTSENGSPPLRCIQLSPDVLRHREHRKRLGNGFSGGKQAIPNTNEVGVATTKPECSYDEHHHRRNDHSFDVG